MKIVKLIAEKLMLLIVIAVLCTIFWGWIFTFLTDTTIDKKLTLYVDAGMTSEQGTAAAVELEKNKPGWIRMIQVRPFTYAMFDDTGLRRADMYIVNQTNAETYREWFAPLPQELYQEENMLVMNGSAYGLQLTSIDWFHGLPGEKYYLVMGASSSHNNELDHAATDIVPWILALQ